MGGNDELIFDGRSLAMDTNAKIINQTKAFEESIGIYDFNEISISEVNESEDKNHYAKHWFLDFEIMFTKTGFSKGLIGLSGGIDSAVTAALAVEALGPNNVIGVSLPSAISSEHSKEDARKLAENLGIEYHTLPIEDLVASANRALSELLQGKRKMLPKKIYKLVLEEFC